MQPRPSDLPAYLRLPPGELARRATTAVEGLARCHACPRLCGVDRLIDKWSACKTGRHAVVSNAFAHFGEEDCLRGWNGSGTVFFAHCNLRCVFCQNHDISQGVRPGPAVPGIPAAGLAAILLDLQEQGCHNINFVTPEHVVPQLLEAVAIAAAAGLRLPLVYNTSAYDSLESLALLDGVIDIYMPDFKYWSRNLSLRYLKAEDYPDVARAALREMHRQVGDLVMDGQGIARRGMLLRHLVMPGGLDETRAILAWVASALGPETYVNLMDQYRSAGLVSRSRYPELARRPGPAEFREARATARALGLRLDTRGTARARGVRR